MSNGFVAVVAGELQIYSLVALAAACAILAIFLLATYPVEEHAGEDVTFYSPGQAVYLFDGDCLVDASPEAQRLIQTRRPYMTEWEGLIALLKSRFRLVEEVALELGPDEHTVILADDDPAVYLELARSEETLRISIHGHGYFDAIAHFDALARSAMAEECRQLREATRLAPQLIWQENLAGQILWANPAYLRVVDRMRGLAASESRAWPSDHLFPGMETPLVHDILPTKGRHGVAIGRPNIEQWFDVTSVSTETSVWRFASDANAAVRADLARESFVRTLTKTFADLSVGLAIFDRKRNLTTFNPALLDMTGLPIDFLSGRPSLHLFMHRLREIRKMPEPAEHVNWREKFQALEAAANKGTFVEIWEPAEGLTFRVRGRPHPDGAIAFLFEDISAELTLTRRFRTEIESGQAVLDTLPEGIAVFSPSRTLVICNASYQAMWKSGPVALESGYDFRSALRIWKAASVPSHTWRRLEDFVTADEPDEKSFESEFLLSDGRRVACSATRLLNNMTMVKFLPVSARTATLQALSKVDLALTSLGN